MNNIIICNDFTQIIEHYLNNFDLYEKCKKYSYICIYGSIEFFKSNDIKKIIVHEIYIEEQFRRIGLCSNFIKYFIDKLNGTNKIFVIQSVLSKILYEYLLRFNYNEYKFFLKKDGFVIKKCKIN